MVFKYNEEIGLALFSLHVFSFCSRRTKLWGQFWVFTVEFRFEVQLRVQLSSSRVVDVRPREANKMEEFRPSGDLEIDRSSEFVCLAMSKRQSTKGHTEKSSRYARSLLKYI